MLTSSIVLIPSPTTIHRAIQNDLGYPTWPSGLPPSWSLFLAPNVIGRGGIYSENIPGKYI